MRNARKLSVLIPLLIALNADAQSTNERRNPQDRGKGGTFFDDRERGWFWHEEPLDETEVVEEEQISPSASQSEKTELGVEWLRNNLPKLMDKAMDNPTEDNLANYAYAQRLMVDIGSRFSSRMMDFMEIEKTLDEGNRRPTSAFSLNAFKSDRSSVI